jgi:hypothetical protein
MWENKAVVNQINDQWRWFYLDSYGAFSAVGGKTDYSTLNLPIKKTWYLDFYDVIIKVRGNFSRLVSYRRYWKDKQSG